MRNWIATFALLTWPLVVSTMRTVVAAYFVGWSCLTAPTVMTSPHPPMFYDYYGFPEESYQHHLAGPGQPALAARVRTLLGAGRHRERGRRAIAASTTAPSCR